MATPTTTDSDSIRQLANDPIAALERAVEAVSRYAAEHPGEVEGDLPRIRKAEYDLLGIRDRVQETCSAARSEARLRFTLRRLEVVS
jgi:hypothetical protein